jgi:hypothetical protein
MILDMIRGQTNLRADEGRAHLRRHFLQRVAMIAEALLTEIAIEPRRVPCGVKAFIRAGIKPWIVATNARQEKLAEVEAPN